MNPIQSELVLGFTGTAGEQTVTTVQGDTERSVHCELTEDFLSYAVSEDVNYVLLKGVYSNGEIITPTILTPVFSDDKTEMTFQIDPSFTQVSGVAQCAIVFIASGSVPEFDEDGKLISDDSKVLTTENFRLYIRQEIMESGCLSSTDQVAASSLVPLVIYATEAIRGLADIDANEQIRITNEANRITAEAARALAETDRNDAEAQREVVKAAMEELMETVQVLVDDDHWAQIAKSWAIGDSTSGRDGENTDNAKYYAEQAADSAAASVSSATDAADSAAAANTSKNQAKGYADDAKAEADAAYVSSQDAEESATNAATSEANALTHKNDAEAAKTVAETAATNAAASKNAAAASEINAESYKDLTEGYKDDAAASAAAADGSATDAAASATAAAASEALAAGYLHSLDDDVAAAKAAKTGAETAQTAADAAQMAAETAKDDAETAATNAASSATNAADSAADAAASEDNCQDWALIAHSWAKCEADEDVYPTRTDERTNNAYYWCQQAMIYAGKAAGGVTYVGSIPFASLPADPEPGEQYNINNDFITDSRFIEGAGLEVAAGTDVVFGSDGKWNVCAPSAVSSFNGRKGRIMPQAGDYTKAMVGLSNVDNTADMDKPVSTAVQDAIDGLQSDMETALDDKIDKVSGTEGQLLGLNEDGDVVAMDAPETTPIATADTAGKMKPDDVTVHVDENGVLSVDPSAASALLISGGKICINYDNLNTD